MYEIRQVRQDDPVLKYRWFTTENSSMDLYVWEDIQDKTIIQFQLCYDRHMDEKVLEWKALSDSLKAAAIDASPGRLAKAAPVFTRSSDVDLWEALELFRVFSEGIDEEIRNFIVTRLQEKA